MGHLFSLGKNYTRRLMTEKYRSKTITVNLMKLTVAYTTGELFDHNIIGTRIRKIHFQNSQRSFFFRYNNNPCMVQTYRKDHQRRAGVFLLTAHKQHPLPHKPCP